MKFEFVKLASGVTVVNSTPHPITFMEDDGTVVTVPSSCIINATVEDAVIRKAGIIKFVKPTFIPSEEGLKIIEQIHQANPDALIIGSIIAAQAFPGDVVGMTPCEGFERKPPAEKRMSTTKFVSFESNKHKLTTRVKKFLGKAKNVVKKLTTF